MRALAVALLALAAWRALAFHPRASGAVRVEGALEASLPALSRFSPAELQLPLAVLPSVRERDWLTALRRAGTPITWTNAGMPPATGLSVTRAADPAGAVTITIATGDSMSVQLRDTLGLIDSIRASPPGARLTVFAVQSGVRATHARGGMASALPPPGRRLRPVLVVGSAGWESKFVIAALEERGWTVHSRVRVSPTATVTHGPALPLDTASYAAVVLLDSTTAVAAGALMGYVRNGGGLLLAGAAAGMPSVAPVAPARVGTPITGSLLRSASSSDRQGLPILPLVSLRNDAVEIDRRDGHIVAAARREGAGRVISVGETESWRWRMSGGADAPAEHRAFWSSLVASAAYAPASSAAPVDPEAAPYAALIDALGEPTPLPAAPSSARRAVLPWWLGVSILSLLLAEWVSRRVRGER